MHMGACDYYSRDNGDKVDMEGWMDNWFLDDDDESVVGVTSHRHGMSPVFIASNGKPYLFQHGKKTVDSRKNDVRVHTKHIVVKEYDKYGTRDIIVMT